MNRLLMVIAAGILVTLAGCGGPRVTKENIQKVQKGMTEAEVVSILGAGTPSSRPGVPADLKELTWKDGQNEIDVQFKDDKAVGIRRQTTD